VRFAALTHDLGKGLTPRQDWPRHTGHEEKGASLVRGLCERLRAPRRFRELAVLVARYHGAVHKAGELCPDSLLRLLEAADGFRRPRRWEQLLLACEADFYGRPGYADRPFPQGRHLRKILAAAVAADRQPLPPGSTDPRLIQQQVRERRLRAIEELAGCP
jgi:tRNA nucleotidyltransferase (CCA-adding enzyme)